MGSHHSPVSETVVWLTPPEIIETLGPFDLDPCACSAPRPWPTADMHIALPEDGLKAEWTGSVWMNPPYGAPSVVVPWMSRMADHGNGIALIFARTETDMFFEYVWKRATALFFIRGRLCFCYPNGEKAKNNSGAPSVLVAYGDEMALRLKEWNLMGGQYVNLRAKATLPEMAKRLKEWNLMGGQYVGLK